MWLLILSFPFIYGAVVNGSKICLSILLAMSFWFSLREAISAWKRWNVIKEAQPYEDAEAYEDAIELNL